MAFSFKLKELISGLVLAPIAGGLIGFIVYLLGTDSSQLPGSPIPQNDVLPFALVSGAITFAGVLFLSLKDAVLTGREAKHEEFKEKLEELYLTKLIDEYYEMEKQKMKEQIEELKKQNQNQQKS